MSINLKSLVVPVVMLLLAATAYIYHGKYQSELSRAEAAESNLKLASQTISDMEIRQREVSALDAKYTGELADAKKQLDDLQHCIRTGKCGLRINAKCPANGTTSTGSMGDASSPRLNDSAERDYFTLRERIVTVTKQVGYLQDYINTQCLR
ncbi:lysis protein [Citrobacter amalonaticus]|uniref:lysis protein n=1 Tax=Citrobacter amalonaticus TaxID=35703 RepID=UPI0017883153|nr:lysis protein [Citrobacter amalonaticus]MBE0395351.1 lysis protein [Citrobacter amalonaticus]